MPGPRGISKGLQARVRREERAAVKAVARDSFQNFAAALGIGTHNINNASTYGFNPISRNRTLLEWMYRGSWVCGVAVDSVADDMTRAGIEILGDLDPEKTDELQGALNRLDIWPKVNATAKWSRLYGGCIAVMLIDGQDPSKPLRIETVGKGQFKGLAVLDRWMVQPSLNNLVRELGPDVGQPKFYEALVDVPVLARARIHYSRVLRLDGVDLPYWQKISENMWGMSVIERLYDRLVAFDSTTTGVAQLVYKAHLRTLSIENLRVILGAGGKAKDAMLQQIELMRVMQSTEGLSILDAKDKFEGHAYTFAGLDDVLLQFGQQLSGAVQVPLTRLFGQSPAGLNSTGESDLRTYYDGINQQQNARLRRPYDSILRVTMQSERIKVPNGFGFNFRPLWQLTEVEKAEIANNVADAVTKVSAAGLVSDRTAAKDLRQSSRISGVFSNITDEDIEAADDKPPSASELDDGDGSEVQPGGTGEEEPTSGLPAGEKAPKLRAV